MTPEQRAEIEEAILERVTENRTISETQDFLKTVLIHGHVGFWDLVDEQLINDAVAWLGQEDVDEILSSDCSGYEEDK